MIGTLLSCLVVFSTAFVAYAAFEPSDHIASAYSVSSANGGGDFSGAAHHEAAGCHIAVGCTPSVLPGSVGPEVRQLVVLRAVKPVVQAWRTRYLSPAFKPPII